MLKHYKNPPKHLISYWEYQKEHCRDKNKDWFDYIFDKKFLLYTIITDNNDIIAFSGIQQEGFPEYTCRIGTRSFIDPIYRNYGSSLESNKEPPLFKMLLSQYNWVKNNTDKDNCFASMEFGKTAALKASARKFNKRNIEAKVLSKKYKMFDDENNPSCFQSVLFFKIFSDKFTLKEKS